MTQDQNTVEIVQADRDLASWFTRRMGAGWSDDRIAKMLAKHRLSHSSTPSEVERAKQFNAGYLLAVSNLVNLHGAETEAADMLAELGVTEGILKQMDFADYDAKPLRRLFRDISRRQKYKQRRATLSEQGKA